MLARRRGYIFAWNGPWTNPEWVIDRRPQSLRAIARRCLEDHCQPVRPLSLASAKVRRNLWMLRWNQGYTVCQATAKDRFLEAMLAPERVNAAALPFWNPHPECLITMHPVAAKIFQEQERQLASAQEHQAQIEQLVAEDPWAEGYPFDRHQRPAQQWDNVNNRDVTGYGPQGTPPTPLPDLDRCAMGHHRDTQTMIPDLYQRDDIEMGLGAVNHEIAVTASAQSTGWQDHWASAPLTMAERCEWRTGHRLELQTTVSTSYGSATQRSECDWSEMD